MSYHQLNQNQRYQIEQLLKEGLKKKEIAERLGVHPSTISRELSRNKGLRGYRYQQAQKFADHRQTQIPKAVKMTEEVKADVITLIRQDLSPQQICFYLLKEKGIKLHHETIYRLIYADKKAGGNLYKHLRIAAKNYRRRYGSYDNRGKIARKTSIDERPAIVDERSRIGDWEGDTMIGKDKKSALLTLVERMTLYTIIVKLTGKNALELAEKLVNVLNLFKNQVITLTFDNGLEFAAHEWIAEQLDCKVYFAHPYSSNERATNENTNGLIRQYFPKGTDFNELLGNDIDFVMERLNNRPRLSRGGKSSNEMFLGRKVDLLAA